MSLGPGEDDQRYVPLVAELGNVRAACRIFGIHHSNYYRGRAQMARHGDGDRSGLGRD